jgi:hypothetical protein
MAFDWTMGVVALKAVEVGCAKIIDEEGIE